ncbi:MAG: TIGR03808 family TAT-translocated repetitive protein [Pseudolabrys sp.]
MTPVQFDRRQLLAGTAATLAAVPAFAAPGLDAAQFGLKPGAGDDQSAALERAIAQAARSRVPLFLAPGVYRAGGVKIASGAQVVGVRGATRLTLTAGASLLTAEGGDAVTLSGLTLDGRNLTLPQRRGLLHLSGVKGLRMSDCTVVAAGGNGVALEGCDGTLSGNTILDSADNAVSSLDSKGLLITGNRIGKAGNGGIRIWQSAKRHDGSIVADNTIEDIGARAGGSGQNGNGVNVYRAGGVIVRGNVIRRAAFSAVRGNAASAFQVIGNNCADLKETALYAEFGYEGAVFVGNIVDGAESGISVTNFNEGGRLGVVQGNILRNLGSRAPSGAQGVGIGVEADIAVSGNTIEDAPVVGIRAGWGPYLRNVAVTGNVVRNCGLGIGVSVARGAGDASVSGNVIAGARGGAVVAMEWDKVVADLDKAGTAAYPQLTVANNQVR